MTRKGRLRDNLNFYSMHVAIREITYNLNLWSYQKVTDELIYLLDNIYIRFGSKLYRQNLFIFWTISILDLVISFIDKM